LRYAQGLWIVGTRVEKWNDTAAAEQCKHHGIRRNENWVLAITPYTDKKKKLTAQINKINSNVHTKLGTPEKNNSNRIKLADP
jgi:hypothetical protein